MKLPLLLSLFWEIFLCSKFFFHAFWIPFQFFEVNFFLFIFLVLFFNTVTKFCFFCFNLIQKRFSLIFHLTLKRTLDYWFSSVADSWVAVFFWHIGWNECHISRLHLYFSYQSLSYNLTTMSVGGPVFNTFKDFLTNCI